jgi:hypothetical protein
MSKIRAIPQVPPGDTTRAKFDEAIKENLEVLTGQRSKRITPLADTASTAEIIAKVNELIARLQQ